MTELRDPDPEVLLGRLLDRLGLRYALQRSDAGDPYAGFRIELGRAELHVTAQLLGRALRFRAERAIAPPVDAGELPLANEINLMWRAGRLDGAEGWSLTTWAHGAGEGLKPEAVRFAFDALVDAAGRMLRFPRARFVELAGAAPAQDDEERSQSLLAMTEDQLERWPRAAPAGASPLDRVEAALGRHAGSFQRVAEGRVLVARFIVAGERDFLVDLFAPDGSTLFMRARHDRAFRVAASARTWQALQTINARLALGAAVLDEGTAQYRLSLPVAWTTIEEDLVDWLLSRAHASMRAIEEASLDAER